MAHTVTSQHSSAKVEGLRAATPYVVQVRARTVAGYGRYSNPMDFSTNLHSTNAFLPPPAVCPWWSAAIAFPKEGSGLIAFMTDLIGIHYTSSSSCSLIRLLVFVRVRFTIQVTPRSRCRTSCLSSSARPRPAWWSSLPWWLSLLSALSKRLIFFFFLFPSLTTRTTCFAVLIRLWTKRLIKFSDEFKGCALPCNSCLLSSKEKKAAALYLGLASRLMSERFISSISPYLGKSCGWLCECDSAHVLVVYRKQRSGSELEYTEKLQQYSEFLCPAPLCLCSHASTVNQLIWSIIQSPVWVKEDMFLLARRKSDLADEAEG